MKPMKHYVVLPILVLTFALSPFAQSVQTAYFRTTIGLPNASSAPYCIPWVDSGARAGSAWAATTGYIEIFPDSGYQIIEGFGGCFQEKMYDAIHHLSAAGQDSVIRGLFDTSGCNFNFCRMPIGANDFADSYYSLDDDSADYQMKNFNLHRDSLKLIPLIQQAQVYKPNLRFWASPWTPPAWMKSNDNFADGTIKEDSATLASYALYLDRAVRAFQAKGINIESITCQNEPSQNTENYPTCGWTSTQEINFYHNFMIPRFRQDNVTARIILGVYCCENYTDFVTDFMQDSVIADFVNVISHSFEDPTWGPQAVASYPSIPFYETESNFGTIGAATQVQDWSAGWTIFSSEMPFLSTGRASVYDQWNMVNNQTSQSGWGWAQYVMINVDTAALQVTYNPEFYAQKHISYYVQVGARAVKFITNNISNLTSAAFRNPNGDIIFVTGNGSSGPTPITIKIGGEMFSATLPPNSINTLRIVGTSAVRGAEPAYALPSLGNVKICNSTLYFSLSPSLKAQEADLTLADLQGRAVWNGHRAGSALRAGQQAIGIRSIHGNLPAGTYLLTVKIKNEAGAVTTLEKKVMEAN
jgi:glucosylceramidase